MMRVSSAAGLPLLATAAGLRLLPMQADQVRRVLGAAHDLIGLGDLDDLKRHVTVLADDALEGREAGTRGGYAAGKYLRNEFVRIKLRPGGEDESIGLAPKDQIAEEILNRIEHLRRERGG